MKSELFKPRTFFRSSFQFALIRSFGKQSFCIKPRNWNFLFLFILQNFSSIGIMSQSGLRALFLFDLQFWVFSFILYRIPLKFHTETSSVSLILLENAISGSKSYIFRIQTFILAFTTALRVNLAPKQVLVVGYI